MSGPVQTPETLGATAGRSPVDKAVLKEIRSIRVLLEDNRAELLMLLKIHAKGKRR